MKNTNSEKKEKKDKNADKKSGDTQKDDFSKSKKTGDEKSDDDKKDDDSEKDSASKEEDDEEAEKAATLAKKKKDPRKFDDVDMSGYLAAFGEMANQSPNAKVEYHTDKHLKSKRESAKKFLKKEKKDAADKGIKISDVPKYKFIKERELPFGPHAGQRMLKENGEDASLTKHHKHPSKDDDDDKKEETAILLKKH